MNPSPKIKLFIFPVVLVVIALICFVFYRNQLNLVPKPEQFTELYFENSATLPAQTIAGRPLSFSFTIHNEEGTSTVYPYVVYFENADGGKLILAKSSVTLADDATTTIALSHIFTTTDEEGRIVVDLTSLDQQIDFLLSNPNQ